MRGFLKLFTAVAAALLAAQAITAYPQAYPAKPIRLLFLQPNDYWHKPPTLPEDYWVRHFSIDVIREAAEARFGGFYAEEGRPGIPIRLMVGLHYLKHTFNESDESVVARWVENPYWQYFCGEEYFRHTLPIDPSQMTRFRDRVGAEGCEYMLSNAMTRARSTVFMLLKSNVLPRAKRINPTSSGSRWVW